MFFVAFFSLRVAMHACHTHFLGEDN